MDLHRILSLALAAVYLIFAFTGDGVRAVALAALPLSIVLALIWFPDPFADFTGRVGFTPVARSSPPGMVRGLGWLFLLAPLVVVVIAALRS